MSDAFLNTVETMFFLVNAKNDLVRKGDNRMALRRARRKLPEKDSLRIIEGSTLAYALSKEAKATTKIATKAKATKEAKTKVAKVDATVKEETIEIELPTLFND